MPQTSAEALELETLKTSVEFYDSIITLITSLGFELHYELQNVSPLSTNKKANVKKAFAIRSAILEKLPAYNRYISKIKKIYPREDIADLSVLYYDVVALINDMRVHVMRYKYESTLILYNVTSREKADITSVLETEYPEVIADLVLRGIL